MGEFYGDFMGLSNNEISVNETENDNEEGNDPTENLQNDTTNNDNTLGADANVLGTKAEEELLDDGQIPTNYSGMTTRSSSRIENILPQGKERVLREMRKLGAYYNPATSNLLHQARNTPIPDTSTAETIQEVQSTDTIVQNDNDGFVIKNNETGMVVNDDVQSYEQAYDCWEVAFKAYQ